MSGRFQVYAICGLNLAVFILVFCASLSTGALKISLLALAFLALVGFCAVPL